MLDLLERAFDKVSQLPEDQQAIFAQWILDELEDEERWTQAFANSLPQLEKLGQKALADHAQDEPNNWQLVTISTQSTAGAPASPANCGQIPPLLHWQAQSLLRECRCY